MQLLCYGVTLFFSAYLLFWIEPLASKMLLPLLGGVPAVWTTCLVFFQGMLLLGYCYAHAVTRYCTHRTQYLLQLALLLAALFFLPMHLTSTTPIEATQTPIMWILEKLLCTVGLPFFVLATMAPLLQKWFAVSRHDFAGDPYFLYSASNIGSICALLAFPFFLEPYFGIHLQIVAWAWLFVFFAMCLALCGSFILFVNKAGNAISQSTSNLMSPTKVMRLRWLLLAFVPSSLLLGVTSYLTTDITSAPLLWVIPLVLYLLTFIIAFARNPPIPHRTALIIQPLFLLLLLMVLPLPLFRLPIITLVSIHLLAFFITALVCHGELVANRPSTSHLTEFYLYIALGGLLGGIFNAIVAPLIFDTILEYPLAIVLACMLRPNTSNTKHNVLGELGWLKRISKYSSHSVQWVSYIWRNLLLPLGIAIFLLIVSHYHKPSLTEPMSQVLVVSYLVAAIIILLFPQRPFRFGLCILVFLWVRFFVGNILETNLIYQERNFYGTLKVTSFANGDAHVLFSSTTMHGAQFIKGNNKNKYAFTYYVPIKNVLRAMRDTHQHLKVAVAGMGVGTLSCFVRKQDSITYFEIDPSVVAIAKNPNYFTYLSECPPQGGIILGDARIHLARQPAHYFDVIVLDTFSSDAIPVHILTEQAVMTYLQKLSTNGVLIVHITNRYLKLTPVLAAIAHTLQLTVYQRQERNSTSSLLQYPSTWVLLARDEKALEPILKLQDGWRPLAYKKGDPLWTDDYSNIWRIFRYE